MRVLVTGARGFVGRHLVTILRERGHEVLPVDREPHGEAIGVDVTDPLAVRGALELAAPDAVAHLAGQAFVPAGTSDPGGTFAVNAGGTLHVLEAARALGERGTAPRVLVVSSAEVYGKHEPRDFPLREETTRRPATPYAASKVAAEALATAYAATYGLDVVVTRAFNHIGRGQDQRFAVAAFAAGLARIAAGEHDVLWVGNLDAARDFLDVRDVCAAYAAILEGRGAAGAIYNVCSGTATPIREILRRLIEIAGIAVEVRQDPERMRPSDVPVFAGDPSALRAATGWTPAIPLPAALREVYDDARARLQVTR